jgi:hypothetical protein
MIKVMLRMENMRETSEAILWTSGNYTPGVLYSVISQVAKIEFHCILTLGGDVSQFVPAIVKPVTDHPVCTPPSLLSQHAILPGSDINPLRVQDGKLQQCQVILRQRCEPAVTGLNFNLLLQVRNLLNQPEGRSTPEGPRPERGHRFGTV